MWKNRRKRREERARIRKSGTIIIYSPLTLFFSLPFFPQRKFSLFSPSFSFFRKKREEDEEKDRKGKKEKEERRKKEL